MRYALYTFWGFFICLSLNAKDNEQTTDNFNIDAFRASIKTQYELDLKVMPNTQRKYQECIDLVERGVKYLQENHIDDACKAFRYSTEWYRGEIFNFVLDEEGHFLCHGDNSAIIWKTVDALTTLNGEPILKVLKKINNNDGLWLNYKWNNGYKLAFIKKITIHDKIYYIGAGYFPHSKEYITEQIVKSAIAYFKQVPPEIAFTRISNANDFFVFGDVSMYVTDFDGNIVASSYDPGFIGQNLFQAKNNRGEYYIQNIINALKKKNNVWLDYQWLNEYQRNYAERLDDTVNKKSYAFVGNYHPEMNELSAIDLLDKALQHIKKVGVKEAFHDFNNPVSDFTKDVMFISVYDFNGNNVANGEYPGLKGKNLLNRKDVEGKYVVRDLINLAKKNAYGMLTTLDKNSYEKLFFKTIDTKEGKYIVVSSIYVQSKEVTVKAMVEKALRYITDNPLGEGIDLFSDPTKEFYFGDVYVFISTMSGILLANGEYKNTIWKNGNQEYLESMVAIAKKGGGWISHPYRNTTRRMFIKPYTIKQNKQQQTYIIGSSYCL